jgi:hypothetical protein
VYFYFIEGIRRLKGIDSVVVLVEFLSSKLDFAFVLDVHRAVVLLLKVFIDDRSCPKLERCEMGLDEFCTNRQAEN